MRCGLDLRGCKLPRGLQSMRPVFVGADLGRTPLSTALDKAGHSAASPTLFLAGARA